jgi:6-phosphogluconolactonase
MAAVQSTIYGLDEKGAPTKWVAGRDEGRKEAHCILAPPDNRNLYIPYVKGNNALLQYRFDAETGDLSPMEPSNAMPPDGTGPRHMAYHPTLPVVYFSNEQHLGVSVYDRDSEGRLRFRKVCDALKADEPKEGISSSDIVITPDGRFLFAGIRGHQRAFDWIARYRIAENADGAYSRRQDSMGVHAFAKRRVSFCQCLDGSDHQRLQNWERWLP